MPKRVQRERSRGWKSPPDTVYVGRPSRWGNPFRPFQSVVIPSSELAIFTRKLRTIHRETAPVEVQCYGIEQCLAWFRVWACCMRELYVNSYPVGDARGDWLAPLRGKDLACWCPLDQPCHADILLELANR